MGLAATLKVATSGLVVSDVEPGMIELVQLVSVSQAPEVVPVQEPSAAWSDTEEAMSPAKMTVQRAEGRELYFGFTGAVDEMEGRWREQRKVNRWESKRMRIFQTILQGRNTNSACQEES